MKDTTIKVFKSKKKLKKALQDLEPFSTCYCKKQDKFYYIGRIDKTRNVFFESESPFKKK